MRDCPTKKREYVKREKFLTMEEYTKKENKRKPKQPKMDDLSKTRALTAVEIVGMFQGAAQLVVDCNAAALSREDFTALVERSLSNRCRTEATRERVCRFVQEFLEFALQRPDHSHFMATRPCPRWCSGLTMSAYAVTLCRI